MDISAANFMIVQGGTFNHGVTLERGNCFLKLHQREFLEIIMSNSPATKAARSHDRSGVALAPERIQDALVRRGWHGLGDVV